MECLLTHCQSSAMARARPQSHTEGERGVKGRGVASPSKTNNKRREGTAGQREGEFRGGAVALTNLWGFLVGLRRVFALGLADVSSRGWRTRSCSSLLGHVEGWLAPEKGWVRALASGDGRQKLRVPQIDSKFVLRHRL